MKRKREPAGMPPEYVKGPGKKGELHPHWRKSFPDDEEDADGRGKVEEGLPGHGVWRRVPGIWMILASEDGNVMTVGASKVRKQWTNARKYLVVGCNNTPEAVHLLVCRAFHGKAHAHHKSVDHLGGKDLPCLQRRSDNRACNLAWATYDEQRDNQSKRRKSYSSGYKCLIWRVTGGKQGSVNYMTRVGEEMSFPSALDAATKLGLDHGNLSHVLNGTNRIKTTGNAKGERFTGEYVRDDTDLHHYCKEEWEFWPREAQAPKWKVSNHGRIQIKTRSRWGPKHFPYKADGQDYVKIGTRGIHVIVGELFFIGPRPLNWQIWDHRIPGDTTNNHILNLHPVTREENGVNTARQRDFYIWPKDAPDQRERCVSQHGAARTYNLDRSSLGRVLHKRPDKRGCILKTVGGYCAAFCDEVDKE